MSKLGNLIGSALEIYQCDIEILMSAEMYNSVLDTNYEIKGKETNVGYVEQFMMINGVKVSKQFGTMGKTMAIIEK